MYYTRPASRTGKFPHRLDLVFKMANYESGNWVSGVGHGQSGSETPGYIEQIVKGGKKVISNAIKKVGSIGESIQWESPPRGVCQQCHTSVPPEREFCSVECSDQCWREYRNYYVCTTGELCSIQLATYSTLR